MLSKIDINCNVLYKDLMELLGTPGPTQACVKISKTDPRITGEFPMEKKIKEIINRMNEKEDAGLQIIRDNGNLLVIGGMGSNNSIQDSEDISKDIAQKIREIKLIFGAHLDEISYFVTRKKGFLEGKNRRILPICAPPILTNKSKIWSKDKKFFAQEIHHPDCRIVGFRKGQFVDNIAKGTIYLVKENKKIEDKYKIDNQEILLTHSDEVTQDYLLLKIIENTTKIKEGDLVIQDYGFWKKKKKFSNDKQKIVSKALDDRVGCLAAIYTIKELSKSGKPSKAILTSAEEGVPKDISWGRLIRPTYKKFCTSDTITIVCDGIDGNKIEEFPKVNKEIEKAIVIPYTSIGKGGGDLGVFSLFRDSIIPEINRLYDEEIVVTSTDYSSRSFEVKIMDDWTNIGFVQWSCGRPVKILNNMLFPDDTSICHNHETFCFYQLVNIIRTLYASYEIILDRVFIK